MATTIQNAAPITKGLGTQWSAIPEWLRACHDKGLVRFHADCVAVNTQYGLVKAVVGDWIYQTTEGHLVVTTPTPVSQEEMELVLKPFTPLVKPPIQFDAEVTFKPSGTMPRTVEYTGHWPEQLIGKDVPDSISAACELDGVKYSGTLYREDRYTTPKKSEYK